MYLQRPYPRTDLRTYLSTSNVHTLVPTYGHILYHQRQYPRTDLRAYLVPPGTDLHKIHLVPLPPFMVQPNGSPWYKSFNEPTVQTLCLKHTLLSGTIGHRFHLHPAVNIPDEMSALTDDKTPGFVPGTSHQTLKSEICTIRPPI